MAIVTILLEATKIVTYRKVIEMDERMFWVLKEAQINGDADDELEELIDRHDDWFADDTFEVLTFEVKDDEVQA